MLREFPDMREMARFATESYAKLDATDKIRSPYPPFGTPNWWALRVRYEELLAIKQASLRKAYPGADMNSKRAEGAKWAALGNERAVALYEAGEFT